MHRLTARAFQAALLCSIGAAAWAQEWPQRPIRIVAPFAPGGVTDMVARAAAASMSIGLGQPVIVENKPGAQGVVGTSLVKNAAPDGYTIVLMSSSVGCVNPAMRKSVPFDITKDFAPIGMIGAAPMAMVVSANATTITLDQFIAHAKANPDKVSYSSPGIGGSAHLYGAVMNATQGLNMQLVPYQGGAPALQAVLAGETQMTFADLGSASGQLQAGKLRALAVSGDARWPALANVPTFAEAGYPINLVGWVGLMAPSGTPPAVVRRLNAELRRFVDADDSRGTLLTAGVAARSGSAEQMASAVRETCPAWADAVRKANIQPE
ncbi:MAG: tripartite tricarboxylate transporter substrate-binding protein [Pseudomonadota bacterium]|nr:tripartite tricarboxylate transporter substrate-binding protein [Pseudomonadota bacterium]